MERIALAKLAYFDVLSPKLMIILYLRGVAGERCDAQRAASALRKQRARDIFTYTVVRYIFCPRSLTSARALSDHIFKVEFFNTVKQLVGKSCLPPILRVNNFHTFGHTFDFTLLI